MASIIFDAIRDKMATKADVDLLHAEVVGVRSVTTGVQEELVLLAHKADVHMVSTKAAHVREKVAHLCARRWWHRIRPRPERDHEDQV